MTVNTLARAALLGLAAACLAACATIRAGTDRSIIRSLALHLDEGDGAELARISQVPFLLDGEVVVLPEDVESFWTAVAAGAWSLDAATISGGTPVDEESYKLFAPTQEARAFFKRYVGPGSRLIELTSPEGERVLVLVQEKFFSRRLLGFSTARNGGGS